MLQGSVSGVRIRGYSSSYETESKGYISPIEFEKIKISSDIGVRFSIE